MNLDPLNLAFFNGRWDARWTPAAATNYLLEQNQPTVKTTTYEAALQGLQEGDHPLGCRHRHRLGHDHRRDRGHHLGASSSVWRSTRRGVACSST